MQLAYQFSKPGSRRRNPTRFSTAKWLRHIHFWLGTADYSPQKFYDFFASRFQENFKRVPASYLHTKKAWRLLGKQAIGVLNLAFSELMEFSGYSSGFVLELWFSRLGGLDAT